MPFREVTMIEIKEVLRLWLAGVPKKRAAAQLGLDPKTVRSLVRRADALGLHRGVGEGALTDDFSRNCWWPARPARRWCTGNRGRAAWSSGTSSPRSLPNT